jgi:hypothetical protein
MVLTNKAFNDLKEEDFLELITLDVLGGRSPFSEFLNYSLI